MKKIGEQQELANKSSHDWHSPAFDIVGKTSAPSKSTLTPTQSPAPSQRAQVATGGALGAGAVGAGALGGGALAAGRGHEAAPLDHSGVVAPNNLPVHDAFATGASKDNVSAHETYAHGSEGLNGSLANTFGSASGTAGHQQGLASGLAHNGDSLGHQQGVASGLARGSDTAPQVPVQNLPPPINMT